MPAATTICDRDDCDQPPVTRGLCRRHYVAFRKRMGLYGKWESTYVDGNAARDRIIALTEAGMPLAQIAARIGSGKTAVQRINKHPGGEGLTASRRIVDAILAIDPTESHRAYLKSTDRSLVDGTGSRRRLRSLVAAGWTQRDLAARCGWTPQHLGQFIHDDSMGLAATTARRIAELFTELQLTPKDEPSARSLRIARNKGWVPPMAWDEDSIDDPNACPVDLADDDQEHVVDEILVERCVMAWRTDLPAPYVPRGDREAVAVALLRAGATRKYTSQAVGLSVPTLAKRLSA